MVVSRRDSSAKVPMPRPQRAKFLDWLIAGSVGLVAAAGVLGSLLWTMQDSSELASLPFPPSGELRFIASQTPAPGHELLTWQWVVDQKVREAGAVGMFETGGSGSGAVELELVDGDEQSFLLVDRRHTVALGFFAFTNNRVRFHQDWETVRAMLRTAKSKDASAFRTLDEVAGQPSFPWGL